MSMLLQNWVEAHASATPAAAAVVLGDEALTYEQLEAESNRLARMLQAAGCRRGDRVCLLMPKSPAAIVSIIAVLKAGGIYVPLDPSSPPTRIAKMIASCEPRAVLLDSGHAPLLEAALGEAGGLRPAVGLVSAGETPGLAGPGSFTVADTESQPESGVRHAGEATDPAYILFTSGSTGMPKGVVITHANVAAFVEWANGYFGVTAEDRLSGHTALHFDLSVYDIFGALAAGAELRQVPAEVSLLPNKMADFIRGTGITQWFSVPSVMTYMHKFDVISTGDFPSLKRLLWCGEVLPTPTLMYLMDRLPHVQFTNLYGPTETTIASSYYTVKEKPSGERQPVPIGQACGGESLLVLDEEMRPVAPGETGDLYIGGAGLSTGYWRDPDKTAAAFRTSPASSGASERIYRTGDLAKIGPDGMVYFLGRADTQVKTRGYRVELGEIETALSTVNEIMESAVVAIPSAGFEGAMICCAYVLQENVRVTAADLRGMLKASLPPYMVPVKWAEYPALPRNGSGKVDRVALRNEFAASNGAQPGTGSVGGMRPMSVSQDGAR